MGVFAGADGQVVEKAIQASSSLTGVATCADEEALRAPYPPPKTAEAKAKVAAIREKLAEVKALHKTAKYREGLEFGRKLEEEADAVDYRPVQAEVLYQLGELLRRTGEYKNAETTLYEAARAAGESSDGLLAAKATAELVFVVGDRQARYDVGLATARDAEVMLGVAGGNERIRARLLNNMGSVFYVQGEYDKAYEYLRKALQIWEKALGPEHPLVAASLNNMGLVFTNQGRHDKALEYLRRTLAIEEKALGPQHPEVAKSLTNMGVVLQRQGKYDMALEHYRKSLAIFEKALGSEHPHVAMTLNNLGFVFWRQGEYDKALEHYRKSLAIREKALGPEHPDVAHPLMGMADVFKEQGEYNKALEYYRKALAIYEKTLS